MPLSNTYIVNETPVALSVSAHVSDNGVITYQWYENTTQSTSGGTAISGATGSSYIPSTDIIGTRYYYVVVTNTNSTATFAANIGRFN